MLKLLLALLRRLAHPYRKGHLLHANGSAYMERYALFETRWLSARLHKICTEDQDIAMHDHPFSFVALILSGGYEEARPRYPQQPTFRADHEVAVRAWRRAGAVVFRRTTDRHRVTEVMSEPATWTLFIYGPIRQWWGFYTPRGKIYWKDFATVHEPRGYV